ncbi:hypothetical protein Mal15_35490 [Stieleria maiorica]|uniref:Uncharacterized protein n=1 Tax=Stieleria maiorica TaxID=2795974 RepID=A0A5B9MIK2_9BACT|nr:hypothetical protein Mal15_35490 [Stieleria maiorica]
MKELETRLVRWALFALPIIVPIAFVIAGRYWRTLLFLQPPVEWSTMFSRPAAWAGGVIAACAVLAWWLSLRISHIGSRRGQWFAVAVAVVAVVCVTDRLADVSRARFVLEEAVKSRAPHLDFVRNIAFKQQTLRAPLPANVADRQRIFLVGSSQINLGIDAAQLRAKTSADEVVGVCMPGMVPLQYLAVADPLVRQRPSVVICWVSEFDFFRETTVPTVRLRWLMDRTSLLRIASTLSLRHQFVQRAQLADLALASLSTLWQQRSLFQMVAFRFWWDWDAEGHTISEDEATVGGQLVDQEQGLRNIRRNIRRTPLVDSNFDAFAKFSALVVQSGGRLIVLEGESHPDAMAAYPPEFRSETRRRLGQMAETIGFEYRTEGMRPSFGPDDWRDAVHLNQFGRERLTESVSELIRRPSPAESKE